MRTASLATATCMTAGHLISFRYNDVLGYPLFCAKNRSKTVFDTPFSFLFHMWNLEAERLDSDYLE